MNQASARARFVRNVKDLLRRVRIALPGAEQARRRWRARPQYAHERAMSERVAPTGPARKRARMQTWGLIAIALAVYGMLRFVLGPLPQDPSYRILADTRRCGPIPRAGDVLTNLSILAAGTAGLFLRRRVPCLPATGLRCPSAPSQNSLASSLRCRAAPQTGFYSGMNIGYCRCQRRDCKSKQRALSAGGVT
jgi:hypothetical protein